MPRSNDIRLTCPCGTQFTAKVYQSVNITLDPQLLYHLLAGSLNVAVCPNCGRRASSARPFIYHDMKRGLFAYVHPDAELPEEEREALLGKLRQAYTFAVEESERLAQRGRHSMEMPKPTVRRSRPADDLQERIEPDAPPMQVIFGTDRLVTLVDSLLEPEEKLGKLAISSRSTRVADQERMQTIAQRMAEQMGGIVEVEDGPEGRTIWLYGPRGRVNALAQALNAQQ